MMALHSLVVVAVLVEDACPITVPKLPKAAPARIPAGTRFFFFEMI
jgi:hypothetical protein